MNTLLWALQIILALKLALVPLSHILRPDPAKMERGLQRFGRAARPLLAASSILSFLGALALTLPAATGILPRLTPWAAAFLALLMLVGVLFHVACRERPNVAVGLVLFALAAFVAYGRWVLAPL